MFVEIVFSTKELNKADAEAAIRELTDAQFIIEMIDKDSEADGTVVIVRFVEAEEAANFVRKVDAYTRENPQYIIRRARVVERADWSTSSANREGVTALAFLVCALAQVCL